MASSDLEKNKIFAAILVAGIIAMLSGFIAKKFVHEDVPEEDAYPIEVTEVVAGGEPAPEPVAEPIFDLLIEATAEQGMALARACAACHSFDQGGPNKIGPNLYGVYNNVMGTYPGFAYSDVMANDGRVWDVEALNAFLWKPKKYLPGTKMNYIGMRKAEDRAAMVKYLQSLE
jgi:cytochrome c